MAEKVRVREITNEEGQRLLRTVRRSSGSVVTWRRSHIPRHEANINRLLKTCDLAGELPEALARRAGQLRHKARQGSAVDAIVVAAAEPGGTVLSGDQADLNALANHAEHVTIQRV